MINPYKDQSLLSIREACTLLQCHPNTLRNWDNTGFFKAIRFGRRGDRRYKKNDILRFLGASASSRNYTSDSLLENEQYYSLVIDGIKDYGIFTLDKSGFITKWNKGAQRLLGYKEDEVIGKNYEIFFTKEQRKANKPKRELRFALRSDSVENESWTVRKDKSLFWASGVTSAIRNDKRQIVGLVKILRDMSQAKQAEKEKDEFASIISHELKNPITSISVFTQLLHVQLKSHKDEKSLEYFTHIDTQVKKITRLISNLLEQSKVRAKGFTFKDRLFDVDKLLLAIADDIEKSKPSHKIRIQGKVNTKIRADRERLGQVIENFLTNAIKYSPNAPEVVLAVKHEKGELIISVQDFGPGISEDNIQRIFTPFFRASDTQRESFPSIGLGLYIAGEIISHYHGKMWVESRIGEGATFFVSLPDAKVA